jgi:ferritin
MTMSAELLSAYHDQIALEFSAAYSYLSLASYFEGENLTGFAHWMEAQYREEVEHAEKFRRFLLDRGAPVELRAIAVPAAEVDSPVGAFEHALAGEQTVTAAIHDLYGSALAENDYISFPLLQWFVEEQVEEEAAVSGLLHAVRMAVDDPAALLMLDREVGARGSE